MTMYLRRKASFSAGDGGRLTGTPGGHNYVCELAVSGTIDPVTGMVVNIVDVDAVLKAAVIRPLDGKLLDRDVPAFESTPPTPLNIARYVWGSCGPALPEACRLAEVTIWWTPTSRLTIGDIRHSLSGKRTAKDSELMVTVTRTYEFSASHRLNAEGLSAGENLEIFGKCNWDHGHGHNYEVEVTAAGAASPLTGELLQTSTLDKIVDEEVLTPFDHRHLNLDVKEFATLNPTSENVTKVIWNRIAARWGDVEAGGARLYRVAVRETARNYFEYYGE